MTRTNPIVLDDIAEAPVPVVLTEHPHSAVAVTDEELTLDITDFATRVLNDAYRTSSCRTSQAVVCGAL